MEPDKDQLMAQKIRRLEQCPVVWNKEGVWTRVQEEIDPSPARRYHLAAAVAIGLLFMISNYTLNDTPEESMKPKVITLSARDESVVVKDSVKSALRVTIHPVKKSDHVIPATRRSSLQASEPVGVPEGTLDVVTTPDIEVAVVPQGNNEETEVPALAEEKIRPVIGVIVSDPPLKDGRSKRKRGLHQLQAPDVDRWDPAPSGTLTLARRK